MGFSVENYVLVPSTVVCLYSFLFSAILGTRLLMINLSDTCDRRVTANVIRQTEMPDFGRCSLDVEWFVSDVRYTADDAIAVECSVHPIGKRFDACYRTERPDCLVSIGAYEVFNHMWEDKDARDLAIYTGVFFGVFCLSGVVLIGAAIYDSLSRSSAEEEAADVENEKQAMLLSRCGSETSIHDSVGSEGHDDARGGDAKIV
jgi:hypothetical protein